MKKYPAYVSSCVISNKLIENCRLCYRTRLWRSRLSRVNGRWQVKRHMPLWPELFHSQRILYGPNSTQSSVLKIVFSVNMMVSCDHMLTLYVTNFENILVRRRLRCNRSSSMPSLKNQLLSRPAATNLKTSRTSGGTCRCWISSRNGSATPAYCTTGWGYETNWISPPAVCDATPRRAGSEAARSVPAVWWCSQRQGWGDPVFEARTSKQSGTTFTRARSGSPGCRTQGTAKSASVCRNFYAAYATPVEKKTLHAVAAVAHAAPVPVFHSPGLSLPASAGNLSLKSKNKGGNATVETIENQTPPAAHWAPSVGLAGRRMRSKGPLPQPQPQPTAAGWVPGPAHPGGDGDSPAGDGLPGVGDRLHHPPGLPLQASRWAVHFASQVAHKYVPARCTARGLDDADEVSAHVEPRRAMAVLMNVGKPPIANLKNGDTVSMHIPAWMGSVCAVAQSHGICRLVPVLADNSLLDLAV